MSAPHIHHPHNPAFERFLYASVGEDRKGVAVTVLSALARLNLDPWEEAAGLTALGGDAARSRLGQLLSRFGDVPALRHDHESVAGELTSLLPERAAQVSIVAGATAERAAMSSGMIWTILAVLFLVAQMMFAATSGPGE